MSGIRFRNLTPHPIAIQHSGGMVEFAPERPVPRVAMDRESLGSLAGFDIDRVTMCDTVTGLPPRQAGVILIVSALVAEHQSVDDRVDLAYPGEAVRDDDGKIIGARGLCAGPGLARRLRDGHAHLI